MCYLIAKNDNKMSLNMIYNIITKVIENQLKPRLSGLIFPEQSIFVEGRQITNGIILVHELLRSLRSQKIPGMLVKLDIAKAYDKLNWHFMRCMLESYGFWEDWIEQIMHLVISTFYSILIKGTLLAPSDPRGESGRGIPYPLSSLY